MYASGMMLPAVLFFQKNLGIRYLRIDAGQPVDLCAPHEHLVDVALSIDNMPQHVG